MTSPSRFKKAPGPSFRRIVLADPAVADLAAVDALDLDPGQGYRLNATFQRDVVYEANIAPFHRLLGEPARDLRRYAVQRVLAARARERKHPLNEYAAVQALERLFPEFEDGPAGALP